MSSFICCSTIASFVVKLISFILPLLIVCVGKYEVFVLKNAEETANSRPLKDPSSFLKTIYRKLEKPGQSFCQHNDNARTQP